MIGSDDLMANGLGSMLVAGLRENFVAIVIASILLGLSVSVAVKQNRKWKEEEKVRE